MRQDEAEKLARIASQMEGDAALRLSLSGAQWRSLCNHILSGDMRREIENAAYGRVAKLIESDKKVQGLARVHLAIKVRSLIQPPAQKENGE